MEDVSKVKVNALYLLTMREDAGATRDTRDNSAKSVST